MKGGIGGDIGTGGFSGTQRIFSLFPWFLWLCRFSLFISPQTELFLCFSLWLLVRDLRILRMLQFHIYWNKTGCLWIPILNFSETLLLHVGLGSAQGSVTCNKGSGVPPPGLRNVSEKKWLMAWIDFPDSVHCNPIP